LKTCFEICAGAGGQALGLEQAGFDLAGAAEIDTDACNTLRWNRESWNVLEADVKELSGAEFRGVDLFAGGVPCPPFSIAGKQLGENDERDLFPEALRLIKTIQPKAAMLENVRGFASERFAYYRKNLHEQFAAMGYKISWRVLNASDYSVPQLRPRFILVALKDEYADYFQWPEVNPTKVTVAGVIADLVAANGWLGVSKWIKKADEIAPTIVGGSKKHGGADLGPTRAKQKWLELGVCGKGIANTAPMHDDPEDHIPRLTLRMVARIQGFPDEWAFQGSKTSQYRQIGNAFPAPVAAAVASSLACALDKNMPKPTEKGQVELFDEVLI
jgi:DNA (cytosine-5)-methyltransferase 1